MGEASIVGIAELFMRLCVSRCRDSYGVQIGISPYASMLSLTTGMSTRVSSAGAKAYSASVNVELSSHFLALDRKLSVRCESGASGETM